MWPRWQRDRSWIIQFYDWGWLLFERIWENLLWRNDNLEHLGLDISGMRD